MSAGDILFYHDTPFFAKMIQWATHGPYNHCAIDCGDGTMIHATMSGVMQSPLDIRGVRVDTAQDEKNIQEALEWLKTQIGAPYDFYDILLAGVFAVVPAIAIAVPYIPDDHYICSELAGWFLREAKYPFPGGLDTNLYFQTLSPNELHRVLTVGN